MTSNVPKETKAIYPILDGLMRRYEDRVADVGRIIDEMIKCSLIADRNGIENDHIAFRTLGVPQLGIRSLERIFIYHGYTRRDPYYFEEKKLDAYWYSPPERHLPRVFISELRVRHLTEQAQQIITSYTNEVHHDPVEDLDLDDPYDVDAFLHRALWRKPTWNDYVALSNESEYAAWAIYNSYYLNHFTISVHGLPNGYATIPEFNAFIESKGFVLNDARGKVKVSPDGLLLQSATVAEMLEAPFADGDHHKIPGSYVEFAERRVVNGSERREGFEASNADRIFESTYAAQTSQSGGKRCS
jgi:hypothetical protein